jgi:hypothetical protein
MPNVTIEDRKRELRHLLDRLSRHPEGRFPQERERVAVLQGMLLAQERAQGQALD